MASRSSPAGAADRAAVSLLPSTAPPGSIVSTGPRSSRQGHPFPRPPSSGQTGSPGTVAMRLRHPNASGRRFDRYGAARRALESFTIGKSGSDQDVVGTRGCVRPWSSRSSRFACTRGLDRPAAAVRVALPWTPDDPSNAGLDEHRWSRSIGRPRTGSPAATSDERPEASGQSASALAADSRGIIVVKQNG